MHLGLARPTLEVARDLVVPSSVDSLFHCLFQDLGKLLPTVEAVWVALAEYRAATLAALDTT